MNTPAPIPSGLISKDDFLAGFKLLSLTYRWGEPVTVKIMPATWRQVQKITTETVERELDSAAHAEIVIKSSLSPDTEPGIMDKLSINSMALLQRAALEFTFGSDSKPKP